MLIVRVILASLKLDEVALDGREAALVADVGAGLARDSGHPRAVSSSPRIVGLVARLIDQLGWPLELVNFLGASHLGFVSERHRAFI